MIPQRAGTAASKEHLKSILGRSLSNYQARKPKASIQVEIEEMIFHLGCRAIREAPFGSPGGATMCSE
jgi:hypothetical protein